MLNVVSAGVSLLSARIAPMRPQPDLLQPIRQWLNQIEVNNPELAELICRVIPAQCPFERKLQFKGRTLVKIPPLCKLNPLYDEVVGLRFRALCYLADVCGKEVQSSVESLSA